MLPAAPPADLHPFKHPTYTSVALHIPDVIPLPQHHVRVHRNPSHLLKERIRFLRGEYFVACHHGDEILRIRQVNDIMCPSRDHIHGLDPIAGHLELDGLAGHDVPLLNQSMPMHHDELLPLRVMPMLALRDAWLADVDADLPTVLRVHQLRKRPPLVHVHLHRILELLRRQIRQIQTEQLLRERSLRALRHHQAHRLLELLQQRHDLSDRHLMRHRHAAVK